MKAALKYFILFGTSVLLKAFVALNKATLFLIAFSGMGDMCYSFAFLDSLKEGGYRVCVITKEYLAQLASFYESVDSVKVVSPVIQRLLQMLWCSKQYGEMFNNGENRSRIFYCDNLNRREFEILRLPSVNYMDIQRYVYYGVDAMERFTLPKVPKPDLERFQTIHKDRTVIVNMKSSSMDIEASVFKMIVEALRLEGMEVYTNCAAPQDALAGTKPLSCSIEELYYLTQEIRFMVSIRSGLLDFLQGNRSTYVVLYDDETEWDLNFRKAYDMKGWESESRIYEFGAHDTDGILRRISILCE